MSYLTSDLVTSVKGRANIPTSQKTFQNADFYRFGDEEIRSKIVALVLKNMEEYWVTKFDYTLTANQANYFIPSRAIAGKLRDVQLVSMTDDQQRFGLDRLNPEDLYAGRVALKKQGFYLEGNKVVMFPTPTSTNNSYLRLSYYQRPNSLCDVSLCAQITAINTFTNQVTVTAVPSTMSLTTAVDFVKANPGFDCSAIDQTITNIATNVLTFGSLPTDLVIGDYICPAGFSCVVQVPVELQPLLYQYVVVRCLSAQTDAEALKIAVAELERLEKAAETLISPRVDGKTKRVSNSRAMNRHV